MLRHLPFFAFPIILALWVWLMPPPAALAAVDSQGKEPVGPIENGGHLDWLQKKAVATGQGFPPEHITDPERRRRMARRAAELDARRNLLEVLGAIRIRANTTAKALALREDAVRQEIDGMLRHSVIEKTTDLPGGGAEVRVSVKLANVGLLHLLGQSRPPLHPSPDSPDRVRAEVEGDRPSDFGAAPPLPAPKATPSQPAQENKTSSQAASGHGVRRAVQRNYLHNATGDQATPSVDSVSPPAAAVPATPFSGVIVDAREAGFEPSLAPSLHDEQGEIYPAQHLTPEVISTEGVARFYRDMFAAQSSPAAGASPLTVKAVNALPGRPDALRLSPEDAAQLRAILRAPNSPLALAKVVIVF